MIKKSTIIAARYNLAINKEDNRKQYEKEMSSLFFICVVHIYALEMT